MVFCYAVCMNLTESTWIIIIILGTLNLLAFGLVGVDKSKSAHDHQRVPELYFFIWAIFFSSIGVLLGMLTFHHKTKKLSFIIGIGVLLLQQVALLYFLSKAFNAY